MACLWDYWACDRVEGPHARTGGRRRRRTWRNKLHRAAVRQGYLSVAVRPEARHAVRHSRELPGLAPGSRATHSGEQPARGVLGGLQLGVQDLRWDRAEAADTLCLVVGRAGRSRFLSGDRRCIKACPSCAASCRGGDSALLPPAGVWSPLVPHRGAGRLLPFSRASQAAGEPPRGARQWVTADRPRGEPRRLAPLGSGSRQGTENSSTQHD